DLSQISDEETEKKDYYDFSTTFLHFININQIVSQYYDIIQNIYIGNNINFSNNIIKRYNISTKRNNNINEHLEEYKCFSNNDELECSILKDTKNMVNYLSPNKLSVSFNPKKLSSTR